MRILYATDGSEGAAAAALLICGMPLDAAKALTVLTVSEGDHHPPGDEILGRAADTLGRYSGRVEYLTREGHPVAEIVGVAKEEAADLIVMGSHGRSALSRFFMGSVAERVARHAHCSVLLVRGRPESFRRVVLGVDGSDGAAKAAGWLGKLSLPLGCEVRLVTILANLHEISREHLMLNPPLTERSIPFDQWQRERAAPCLAEVAASLAVEGRTAVTEIRSGDPAMGLLQVAADEGADLIVVGSHGLSALERFLLGSVSQCVLRHAHCSVLIVRGSSDCGGEPRRGA